MTGGRARRRQWVRSGSPLGGRTPIEIVPGLLAVLALIVANAVFVAAEFALVTVDPARLEGRGRAARAVLALRRRLSFHLSGAQLGITLTSLLLGFLAEPVVAQLLEDGTGLPPGASVAAALAIATLVQMVLGELVPKSLALARPEPTAMLLAPVVRVYGLVFRPVIATLDRIAEAAVRRLGIEPAEELSAVRSLPELQLLFATSAAHGTLGLESSDRMARAARLAEKTAADALVPRLDVESLRSDESVDDLVALSRTTGFSRFPVHRGDLDDVVGIVHVRSAHQVERAERATTLVGDLATEALAVPETASLGALLGRLRQHPMAIVVDEYGGTAGVLTLEDVVEELVGEIDDEHDPQRPALTSPVRPGEHVVAGTARADELLDLCGFELPDGPFETIAGLVLDLLGSLPDGVGARVEHEGWTLEVAEIDRHRIASVALRAPDDRAGSER